MSVSNREILHKSRSLRDFIYESNQGRRIVFGPTEAAVIGLLE
ncbi:MAG: DUF4180 domain-containing protein [Firmicutes bacterium]|nr:DUF4180 domain-containing protein [Bacillota bacterium]